MSTFSITAQPRTVTGKKVSVLRQEKLVPGVVYGPSQEAISLSFEYRKLELVLRDAGSTNLINIEVDGKVIPTLAREVQRHVIKGNIMHVDFFAVSQEKKVRLEIPVVIVGVSPVIQSRKAILLGGAKSVRIECLPKDMVNQAVIDISTLKEIGDTIYVRDLQLGSGIAILNEPEEMLAKALQTGAQRSKANVAEGDE